MFCTKVVINLKLDIRERVKVGTVLKAGVKTFPSVLGLLSIAAVITLLGKPKCHSGAISLAKIPSLPKDVITLNI